MPTVPFVLAVLKGTPVWVWALLAYLIYRGLKALRTSVTSLPKLAVIPAIFVIWGIWGTSTAFGSSPTSLVLWMVSFALGTVAGYLRIAAAPIRVDRERKLIELPGGPMTLIVILMMFGVQYAVKAAAALDPAARDAMWFMLLSVGCSGGAAGLFLGRFLGLYRKLHSAPHVELVTP
ncbi:DUF6622 family protein [Microvirga rosea]|uniref:DUF6622 family protein n=1 Tax=Microvirga rosea TaxID=2715425 RepID=UPI001D0B159B|nr:DUF6622 family protein [Microvirga rosea]MCB8821258.1 hypothetical protein [Microvirga rosea]